MSEKFQKIILNELKEYLLAGAGEDFRTQAEAETHTFIVDKNNIKAQLEAEILSRFNYSDLPGGIQGISEERTIYTNKRTLKDGSLSVGTQKKLKEELSQLIEEGADSIFSEIRTKFEKMHETSDSFSIEVSTVYTKLKGGWVAIPEYTSLDTKKVVRTKFDKELESTMFGQISNSYRDARKSLRNKINTLLKADGRPEIKGAFLVVGHIPGSSITEVRTSRSYKNILSGAKQAGITEEQLQELFRDDILLLSKLDANVFSTWKVALESAIANNPNVKKVFGSNYTESNIYKKYQSILETAALKLKNGFITSEGSDSRLIIEKKKQVKNFVKTLGKNKKVRVQSIDTKLNLSKGKPISTKIKRKKPSSSKRKTTVPKAKIPTVKSAKQSTLNLNALKAQINARLSMTIIKNMGTPALENRTGRFARSALVTSIVQTPQGFPSVNYSYRKYPYQTFEPGFEQGSTQRDPRTLIDRSIREIARELITGRFYTRGV